VLGSNSSSRHSLNNVFGTSPSVVPATNVKRLSPPDSLSLVNEEERSVTPIMTPKPTIYTSYLPKPSMPQPYISSFPFGPNVISFVEPPAPPPASLLLPRPERERHTLREAQSFESTSTARIDIGDITMKHSMSGYVKAHPESTLPSTEIWDVIQGYTIQSENPSDSPRIAPPSDPRFVVWGDVQFDRVARSGILTTTTVVSPVSRKKTNKNKKTKEPFVTAPERAIVAASIERWIAQLTSEIDFVELHILLLTYRQFIAPTDLFHLLASRFCWALEPSRDPQDDIVRKLVRIRTFSALRYWLDTFFREDFVPNWRLCRLFTNWVNSLGKDPAVKKFPEVVVRSTRLSSHPRILVNERLITLVHKTKVEQVHPRS
jgi:GDP/GTP exchange factor required for growth at low temperature